MDVQEVVDRFRDAVSVRRVYGEPLEQDGATLLPAARLSGGGGGGVRAGEQAGEEGQAGSGFGMGARPAGAFVFRGGKVRWIPALDLNRAILGGQLVMGLAVIALGRLLWLREERRLQDRWQRWRGHRRHFGR